MQKKLFPASRDSELAGSGKEFGIVQGEGEARYRSVALRLLGGLLAAVAAPAAMAYDPPPADYFPIGVFLQPTYTFDTWKARGINTLVDYAASSQPLETWNAAAVQHGFYMIRAPRADISKDLNEKKLIAWSQPDEPDYNQKTAANPHGITLGELQANYAKMKAADPGRPVYMNFAGGMVDAPYAWNFIDYKTYMKSADIIANDIYPITAWNHPEWIDFSKALNPNDIYNPTPTKRLNSGTTIDVLRAASGGKKQWAYIETSWQDLNGPVAGKRGVTRDEFRGEVWDAIIHGAKGITYFPQRVGAAVFMDDNTPADVAAEMTKQDALISSLGAVINTSNDATDNRVTLTNSNLEGTWRTYNGRQYLFVLNMSSKTMTDLSFGTAGLDKLPQFQVYDELRSENVVGGKITDSFAPYQLHVYVGDSSSDGFLALAPAQVPEPTAGAILVAGAACGLLRRRRAA